VKWPFSAGGRRREDRTWRSGERKETTNGEKPQKAFTGWRRRGNQRRLIDGLPVTTNLSSKEQKLQTRGSRR